MLFIQGLLSVRHKSEGSFESAAALYRWLQQFVSSFGKDDRYQCGDSNSLRSTLAAPSAISPDILPDVSGEIRVREAVPGVVARVPPLIRLLAGLAIADDARSTGA